jgi:hypothetical protein
LRSKIVSWLLPLIDREVWRKPEAVMAAGGGEQPMLSCPLKSRARSPVGKPLAILSNRKILLASLANWLGRRSNVVTDHFVDRLARYSIINRKWSLAERALEYAEEALLGMVKLMRSAESEAVRLAAQDKILDRVFGKAPQHIDVPALRHTEIVYRSAEEIRQELLARGVPKVLLDYTPPPPEDDDSDKP